MKKEQNNPPNMDSVINDSSFVATQPANSRKMRIVSSVSGASSSYKHEHIEYTSIIKNCAVVDVFQSALSLFLPLFIIPQEK